MGTASTLNPKARNGRASGRAAAAGKVSDATINRLKDVFKMLADASRLKILLALARDGEMHVSALCAMLGQSQPAVSHHLTLMRMAGLVCFDRQGKHNFYRLDSAQVRDLLEDLLAEMGNGTRQLQFEDFTLSCKRAK